MEIDKFASAVEITTSLHNGKAEVLRGSRNFLNTDSPEYRSTLCLNEIGVKKGSGQESTLRGHEKS